MARDSSIWFAEFHLEPHNARLWNGTQMVKLKPKAFAVLRLLAERAGQLVTKDELWRAVWPDVTVGDDVLAASIRDIRKALGDTPKTPRFIETVHRRGYRWIAPLTTTPPVGSSQYSAASSPTLSPTPNTQPPAPSIVGRETELTQLHQWLEQALGGERQIVFLTGEPGIGKTALVEAFLLGIRDWGLGVGSEERQDWRRTGEVASPSDAKLRRPIPNPQPPALGLPTGNALNNLAKGKRICLFSRPWAS